MAQCIRIGVLALQGAFAEHINILNKLSTSELSINAFPVKTQSDLESSLDGLIIPGGESTTMALIAERSGVLDFLGELVRACPTWGTCAGLILLSKSARHAKAGGQRLLNVLDVVVDRNAFGSQAESFMTQIDIGGVTDNIGNSSSHTPFPAVFIRAPIVEEVGENVQVLGRLSGQHGKVNGDRVVAVRQDHLLGTSFHPELTQDYRMHLYFVNMVLERKYGKTTLL